MSSRKPRPQDWFTKTIKVTVTKDYIGDEKSEDRQEEENIDKTDLEERFGQNPNIPVIIIISQDDELFTKRKQRNI